MSADDDLIAALGTTPPASDTDVKPSMPEIQRRAAAKNATEDEVIAALGVKPQPPSPSPLTHTYQNGAAIDIPAGSFEYPGGGSTAPDIKGMWTGDSSVKRPEVPFLSLEGLGLGVTDPKAWGLVGNMMTSRNPADLERGIQSRVPEAKFAGEGDERTVQVPGGPEMYLDRPGVTPQKTLFYAPQTAAAIASGGRSLPAQMALGGTQHGLSQALSYLLGGAPSPVDPIGTIISAAAPGLLGAAGAGLIKGYDWLNSEAAPSAADAIKKLGIEGLSRAEQAAAIAADRARTLYKFGFAGKPGDILDDPVLVAKEDLAANSNASSDAARATMADFHRTNAATALEQKRLLVGQNAGDIAADARTPPPGYFPNESTFGDKVNDAIVARDKILDETKRTLWAKNGDISPSTPAGQAVEFSPDVSKDVLTQARQLLRDRYGAPQGPGGSYTQAQLQGGGGALVNAVDQMERIMQPGGNAKFNPSPYQPFNLGHLQDLRQVTRNIMDENARGTPAFGAAARLKGYLDDAVDNAVATPGRTSGSALALNDFREANAASAAHFAFRNPEGNDAAAGLIDRVLHPTAPATGQETVNAILGGGSTVTPGGGTNAILTHLQDHLGDNVTKPLAGATTMRSLYGTRGTTVEGPAAPVRYDYDSTAARINAQIEGQGGDMAERLLSPEARARMGDLRDALNILGTAGRKGGPRQNASGTGYINMMSRDIPYIGKVLDKIQSTRAANQAVQGGAELVQRAVQGANTAGDLRIAIPRQSTIRSDDLRNPFLSWQPEAWRAGTPAYRGGGLLGAEALDPRNR